MKTELTPEAREDLINYRLKRCKETLEEVDYLIKGKFYNAAVSRLYYACYYAVVALLVQSKLEAQSHAGVKAMFSLNFLKPNIFDRELAKGFFQLFDLRHNNDYDDFCFCDEATILKMRPWADKFINEIEKLIENP